MNSLKKIFIENYEPSVARVFDGFDESFDPENRNEKVIDSSEIPSLQMRYMIDDYDELFDTDSKKP